MLVYKIFRPAEWDKLQRDGATDGAPIDVSDGYIHLSTAEQTPETLSKHFAGAEGLILCAVETDTLGDALKWEPSRGGALFPHLYRRMVLDDIAWHAPIGHDGSRHVLPDRMA